MNKSQVFCQSDEIGTAEDISSLFAGGTQSGGPYSITGFTVGEGEDTAPICWSETNNGGTFENTGWFVFTPLNSGDFTISTNGSCLTPPATLPQPDTQIAIYLGMPETSTLSSSFIANGCNDDLTGSNYTSSVNVTLVGGEAYYILVDTWNDPNSIGDFCIEVISGGQECDNAVCEGSETYTTCPGDCPCNSTIRFLSVDLPNNLIANSPLPILYCSSSPLLGSGTAQDPPIGFIPVVINFDGEPEDPATQVGTATSSSTLSTDFYSSTQPPSENPTGTIDGFIFYLAVSAEDIAAGSLTIDFNNTTDNNCSNQFVVNLSNMDGVQNLLEECVPATPIACSEAGFGFSDIAGCYSGDPQTAILTIENPNGIETASNGNEIGYLIVYATTDGSLNTVDGASFANGDPITDPNAVNFNEIVLGSQSLGFLPFAAAGCAPLDIEAALIAFQFDAGGTGTPLTNPDGTMCYQIISYTEYPQAPTVTETVGSCGTAASVAILSVDGTECFTSTGDVPDNSNSGDCNEPMTYSFEFNAGANCSETFTGTVLANCDCLGVGIEEINSVFYIQNPINGTLNISFYNEVNDGQVAIYDLAGKLMEAHKLKVNSKSFTTQLVSYATGTYLVKVTIDGQEYAQKVVKL